MTDAVAETLTEPTAEPAVIDQAIDTGPSEDDNLGAAFDRIMSNNGADRGEDGKFTSPKAASPASPASPESGETGEAAAETTAEVVASPAPANWNGLDDVWKALPGEHQAKVKAHFDDLHRRMSEQGRQLSAVKPYADHMARAVETIPLFKGMAPDQVSQKALELAGIAVQLRNDPVNTLISVAHTAGALDRLAARLNGHQPQQQDNVIDGLNRKVAELESRLAKAADPSQIDSHISRAFETRAAETLVNQFASDPANSFFAEVRPHMARFWESAVELNPGGSDAEHLKAAYEMAINAIPSIREKVQAAAKVAAEAASKDRTEAATRAASINVKTASNGKERIPSEEEALSAAYDRATAH
jgi:hypothetical protein